MAYLIKLVCDIRDCNNSLEYKRAESWSDNLADGWLGFRPIVKWKDDMVFICPDHSKLFPLVKLLFPEDNGDSPMVPPLK